MGKFNRKNLSQEVQISRSSCTVFSCGDANQVIIWVLDRDQSLKKITTKALESLKINLKIPGLSNGLYAVIGWDTLAGKEVFRFDTSALEERNLEIEALLPASDIAIAVRKTAI